MEAFLNHDLLKRLGKGGGPAACLTPLWRALGPALAGMWPAMRRARASRRMRHVRTRGGIATTSSRVLTVQQALESDPLLREQIAGDEIWPDNPEARIATAFSRHYPTNTMP